MDGLSSFVKAIDKYYEKISEKIEEEQKIPPKEILKEVCSVLLNVSCMREEGRFPVFRVCFIGPQSEFLDAYIYAHAVLFKKPIEFRSGELHKLAPALNADMSYLMLDTTQKPFKAVGILAAYTTWEKIITKEITTGNRMPRIPISSARIPSPRHWWQNSSKTARMCPSGSVSSCSTGFCGM